ncbi:hypothetical protein LEP1GSC050_3704 [Leptospira broomii serovar Hurstbridge str. 5399]|uniref:Uncharacterized protein n=1 Tax=Leptospira broomii serovar Hurstbridge str. 5399 TaxID=1049789 RepID=T0F9D1_9LEPT|nr:hypothetical protein LEP1GSC050_3704 [Leptospira broomii serovar Hurstbridge str. 5399]
MLIKLLTILLFRTSSEVLFILTRDKILSSVSGKKTFPQETGNSKSIQREVSISGADCATRS